MKSTKKPRRKGLIVQPDDLNVAEWYTVYGLKDNPKQAVQIAGLAFRIVAMNLPFVIGRPASDPANPITLDTRYLTFMRVDDDYVAAQRQSEGTA
jgi:hypothetical protein